MNARIADLIREGRADEITDAGRRRRVLRHADVHPGADRARVSRPGRPRDRGERRDEQARLPRRARAGAQAQGARRERRTRGRGRARGGPAAAQAAAAPAVERRRAPSASASRVSDAPARATRGGVRAAGLCQRLCARRYSRSCRQRSAVVSTQPRSRCRAHDARTEAARSSCRCRSPRRRRSLQRSAIRSSSALAARRRRVRHPVAGARGDQQDRVELRPQHGAELGRRDRLDAVHAAHVAALGHRRERRRHRRSVERRPTRSSPPPATSPPPAAATISIAAVFAYNHADWYVREVLELADTYRRRRDDRALARPHAAGSRRCAARPWRAPATS